jgi:hypothetical protein
VSGGAPGAGPDPGLCGTCARVRVVESARGSRFYLCRLSETDPRYPRYPRLPVLRCRGHLPTEGTGTEEAAD